MSSPFSTFQEFSEAKGPIYTFANNPGIIYFLLLVSLAITVYFFYASFSLKQEQSPSQSAKALGALLLAGGLSLFSGLSQPQKQPDSTRSTRTEARSNSPAWQPLAALGLMGGTAIGRKPRRKVKRSTRSAAKRRSIR
jgi:hypothetical protein